MFSFIVSNSFAEDGQLRPQFAEGIVKKDTILTYQIVDGDSLKMYLQYPDEVFAGEELPCMVFYFGGGWIKGGVNHFKPQADYFTGRGVVTIRPFYRTRDSHGVSPKECVKDAKSALRFIRANARDLGIKPDLIAAGGGSAGGHLAAACALIKDFNHPQDDLTVSPVPNALVLFNPVLDNGPKGYGYNRVKLYYKRFSPLHNLRDSIPPTLILLGDQDALFKKNSALKFIRIAKRINEKCKLILYEDQVHGFFNPSNKKYHVHTIQMTDEFLQQLGYLRPLEISGDASIGYKVF
jgi:acetyl esterase/lipase